MRTLQCNVIGNNVISFCFPLVIFKQRVIGNGGKVTEKKTKNILVRIRKNRRVNSAELSTARYFYFYLGSLYNFFYLAGALVFNSFDLCAHDL